MIITSVIKVESGLITLENDDTGETYELPVSQFPEMTIEMGQIFEWDTVAGELHFDEEETKTRKEKVASLLAQLYEV